MTATLEDILSKRKRDELIGLARSMGVRNPTAMNKSDLVAALLRTDESQLRQKLFPNWWSKYHNHVYGVAGLIGLGITVWLADWPSSHRPEPPLRVQATEVGNEEIPIPLLEFESMTPPERLAFMERYRGTRVVWVGYLAETGGFEPGNPLKPVTYESADLNLTIVPARFASEQVAIECLFKPLGLGDAGISHATHLSVLTIGQRVRVSGQLSGDAPKPILSDSFLEYEYAFGN